MDSLKDRVDSPWLEYARRHGTWLVLALTMIFVLGVRWRLREMPLERDEGEYAYIAQLMLEGVAPYEAAYTMKWPGTPLMYGLSMVAFGQTPAGIRTGLMIVNLASVMLVFFIGRRLFNVPAGLFAAVCFALMAVSPAVLGVAAHATHYVVLFSLGGILLLMQSFGARSPLSSGVLLLLSGILFGMATLMKQHGAVFGLFGLAWLLGESRPLEGSRLPGCIRRACLFIAGFAAPLIALCLWLSMAGVFDKFTYWTIRQAAAYTHASGSGQVLASFLDALTFVIGPGLFAWLMAAGGLVVLIFWRGLRRQRSVLIGLLVVSVAAVCPGFYFRSHYFILLLPSAAFLCGAAVYFAGQCGKLMIRWVAGAMALWTAASLIIINSSVWFNLTPTEVSRLLYGAEPFPESLPIAEYIRTNTAASDTIAVLGSEPQIFFYSRRRSATGYLYMYPLMDPTPEAEKMQTELIKEIESKRPSMIAYVRSPVIWLKQTNSPDAIFRWADGYLKSNYVLCGIADQISPTDTQYRFGSEAEQYQSQSEFRTEVFKRIVRP